MAQGAFYVTKTTLEGAEEVRIDGRSVIESHATLQATPAEPRRPRAGGAVRRAGGDPGQRCEPHQHLLVCGLRCRAAPAHRASTPAPARRPRPGCASSSPRSPRCSRTTRSACCWAAASTSARSSDVWVLDGRPLLTNWGVLPAAAARSGRAREEHFHRTLGRYMALRRATAALGRGLACPPRAGAASVQRRPARNGRGDAPAWPARVRR